jgi:Na+/glutamate symporter
LHSCLSCVADMCSADYIPSHKRHNFPNITMVGAMLADTSGLLVGVLVGGDGGVVEYWLVMSGDWSEVRSEDWSVQRLLALAEWSAAMLGNWSEMSRIRRGTAGRSTSGVLVGGDVGGLVEYWLVVMSGINAVRSEDRPGTSRSDRSGHGGSTGVTGTGLPYRRTGRFNKLRWRNGRRRCWATGRRTVGEYVGDRW